MGSEKSKSKHLTINTHKGQQELIEVPIEHNPFEQLKEVESCIPLTPAQEEIWSSLVLAQESALAFNESIALRINGSLDHERLETSFNQVCLRHESLRSSFTASGDAMIVYKQRPIKLVSYDLRNESSEQKIELVAQHTKADRERPFDPKRDSLVRLILFQLEDQKHKLIINTHHMICDGWSFGVILHEFFSIYHTGQATHLPEAQKFTRYAKSLIQSHEAQVAKHLSYWKDKLAGCEYQEDLPFQAPRPKRRSFHADFVRFPISKERMDRYRKIARKKRVSLNSVLVAAYSLVLSKSTRSQDIAFGMPIAAQSHGEWSELVGHLVSMVPIRLDLDSVRSLDELIRCCRDTILEAADHYTVTFGQLLQALSVQRSPNRIPLISTVFNYDLKISKSKFAELCPNLEIDYEGNPRASENFEIFCNLSDSGADAEIELHYNRDLFDRSIIDSFLNSYVALLDQIADNQEQDLHKLSLLQDSSYKKLEKSTLANPDNFLEEVLQQFDKNKDRVAIRSKDQSLSYGALHSLIQKYRAALRDKNPSENKAIGIFIERSPRMPALMLACLFENLNYIPLDEKLPRDRILDIIEDAAVGLCITENSLAQKLPSQLLAIDIETLTTQASQIEEPNTLLNCQDTAYTIYTSGTTGKPKGVMISREAMNFFLQSSKQTFEIQENDTWLAVTTIIFDISVLEIYLPLMKGAQIYLTSGDELHDPSMVADLIQAENISIIQATPSYWSLLEQAEWQPNRPCMLFTGGEPLNSPLAKKLLPKAKRGLFNMYGPTEATVWASFLKVEQPERVTIGHCLPGYQIAIVDSAHQLVPQGFYGEIAIAGPALAQGYKNRAKLTQERFVDVSWLGHSDKAYLTGDLGRVAPDGQLEIVSRLDDQIKIRGFRVELDEIKSHILSQEGVIEAAVIVKEYSSNDKRLCAFICSRSNLTQEDLRKKLSKSLPNYMIPQHITFLDQLPRLANGKLNKKELQKIDLKVQAESLSSPRRESQEQLGSDPITHQFSKIWQDILGQKVSNASDDFFISGGHSLLANKLCLEVRKTLHAELKPQDLFESSRFHDLVELIKSRQSHTSAPKTDVQLDIPKHSGPLELSPYQSGMWLIEQIDPDSRVHNLPGAWHLHGSIDMPAFKKALTRLIEDEVALQVAIRQEHEKVQIIHEVNRANPLEVIDYRGIEDGSRKAMIEIDRRAEEKINLDRWPLIRIALYQISENHSILFLMAHHIIWDGWCFDLFFSKMNHHYSAYVKKQEPDPIPKKVTYADYTAWLKRAWTPEKAAESQAWKYWQEQYHQVPEPLDLPLDFHRPKLFTPDSHTIIFKLEEDIVNGIDQVCDKHKVSCFHVLMSAYLMTLYQYSKQRDIAIAVPVQGRKEPEFQDTIGLYVNAVPIRFQWSSDETLDQLFKMVRNQCFDALSHDDMPLDLLLTKLNVKRDLSRMPLCSAMFSYQDVQQRQSKIGDLELKQFFVESGQVGTDIMLWSKRSANTIECGWDYCINLWTKSSAQSMVACFKDQLKQLIDPALSSVDMSTPLLSNRSNHLICGAPLKEAIVPDHHTLKQFAKRAHDTAESLALSFENKNLSYKELVLQVNAFRQQIKGSLKQHEQYVGICLDRDEVLLPAILAVWSLGLAYVPLDPQYPHERLTMMAQDAGLRTVLINTQTDPGLVSSWQQDNFNLQVLKSSQSSSDDRTDEWIYDLNGIAYIIYTSGSTGKPKGVMISHSNLVSFIEGIKQAYQFKSIDKFLALTSISFDISILELYLPLTLGAQVFLLSSDDAQDPTTISHTLEAEEITVMQATPVTWNMLKTSGWQGSKKLTGLCGGEALHDDLAQFLAPKIQRLINVYGPTEATVWATSKHIDDETRLVTIGKPLPGYQALILDEENNSVSPGMIGRLFIGGNAVALGYLNREELTSERFVDLPEGRFYNTGDLVRLAGHAELEYKGREDHQVKLRGFRIELGEVENELSRHKDIFESAVVIRKIQNQDAMIAYICTKDKKVSYPEIVDHLSQTLPRYMIPSAVVCLEHLPKTNNGKIDRKSLPDYKAVETVTNPSSDESTLTQMSVAEQQLVHRFAKSLQIDIRLISKKDNFFDLGGHSLLAINLVQEINQELGHKCLTMRHLLLENVEQIAKKIEGSQQKEKSRSTDSSQSKKTEGDFFSKSKSLVKKAWSWRRSNDS